jgi:topoisomerase-4 subunit A
MKDGSLKVSKVADKVFMGREIIHVRRLAEGRRHGFYTMVYQDGENGKPSPRSFQIGGVTRDKLYPLVKSRTAEAGKYERPPSRSRWPLR